MIEKLQNNNEKIVNEIHQVFQLSYAVEAKILEAVNFPPLSRPKESYLNSTNEFFGYFEKKELAGIIEIEQNSDYTEIDSLVVKPQFFRRGIAKKLIEFVFDEFDSTLFKVETGAKNTPATELYKKLGFQEIKQWDTDFGVRKVLFERRIDIESPS